MYRAEGTVPAAVSAPMTPAVFMSTPLQICKGREVPLLSYPAACNHHISLIFNDRKYSVVSAVIHPSKCSLVMMNNKKKKEKKKNSFRRYLVCHWYTVIKVCKAECHVTNITGQATY